MNVENIKLVRDHIAKENPDTFSMVYWSCGTGACIGGWAERLFPNEEAAVSLDLTEKQAGDLFYMASTSHALSGVTIPDAISVLNILIETGEVNWDQAMANPADLSVQP